MESLRSHVHSSGLGQMPDPKPYDQIPSSWEWCAECLPAWKTTCCSSVPSVLLPVDPDPTGSSAFSVLAQMIGRIIDHCSDELGATQFSEFGQAPSFVPAKWTSMEWLWGRRGTGKKVAPALSSCIESDACSSIDIWCQCANPMMANAPLIAWSMFAKACSLGSRSVASSGATVATA